MKVLITGGTGFFGKALLRHWQERAGLGLSPPAATVFSRDPRGFLHQHPEFLGQAWLTFHQGDILDPDSLPLSGHFTHILHAAADSTLGPSLAPLARYDQIVHGTRNILEFGAAQGVRRFLLVSSGGVYGPQPADMPLMREDHDGIPDPMNPAHAYSIGKRCAEHLCALYRSTYGLETMVARCFAFVGRDLPLDVHFAIGNFIRDALVSDEIIVQGDGSPIRSYMDQRDLALWLSTLLERGRAGQAYNVGSDAEISIRDLAILVRDVLAPMKPVRIAEKAGIGSFRNRYVPCVQKARRELDLEIRYRLPESILEAARQVPARTA